MKRLTHFCLICFLFVLVSYGLNSCKKENVTDYAGLSPCDTTFVEDYSYDTILPSDYLMTYPGSWWQYTNGTIDSCYDWSLVSLNQLAANGNCITVYKDNKVIPRTNYGFIAFDTQIVPLPQSAPPKQLRLIDTLVGSFLDYIAYGGDGENAYKETLQREMVEKLPSLEVNGVTYQDVIHVHTFRKILYYHVWNGPFWNTDTYYARNIGIIKVVSSFINQDPVIKELTSSYIAPH